MTDATQARLPVKPDPLSVPCRKCFQPAGKVCCGVIRAHRRRYLDAQAVNNGTAENFNEWRERIVALTPDASPSVEPTNFHEFEKAFPLLALACKAADYDGDPNRNDLWELCISTALCPRFSEAERELEQLSAPALLSVIQADPGEELDCAPIACRVLTGIFA